MEKRDHKNKERADQIGIEGRQRQTKPDSLVAATSRAMAEALVIESLCKRRLADEYDAAQERGEIQRPSGDRVSIIPDENNALTSPVAEIGLTSKDVFEARQIRDAEQAEPGIVRKMRFGRRLGGVVGNGDARMVRRAASVALVLRRKRSMFWNADRRRGFSSRERKSRKVHSTIE